MVWRRALMVSCLICFSVCIHVSTSRTRSPRQVVDTVGEPQEETFCLCRQVSYGEMVGCDNSDCKYEWFHLACVGLKRPPKGDWFCEECRKLLGKPANDAS